jgi:hypothetical protein
LKNAWHQQDHLLHPHQHHHHVVQQRHLWATSQWYQQQQQLGSALTALLAASCAHLLAAVPLLCYLLLAQCDQVSHPSLNPAAAAAAAEQPLQVKRLCHQQLAVRPHSAVLQFAGAPLVMGGVS